MSPSVDTAISRCEKSLYCFSLTWQFCYSFEIKKSLFLYVFFFSFVLNDLNKLIDMDFNGCAKCRSEQIFFFLLHMSVKIRWHFDYFTYVYCKAFP